MTYQNRKVYVYTNDNGVEVFDHISDRRFEVVEEFKANIVKFKHQVTGVC
jgi:hypothetical protein